MNDQVEVKETDEVEGIRARRAFMLKQFVPAPDWINTNVVAKGKGTKVALGRIWGVATGAERKTNTLPDAKVVQSIAVRGVFQSESYVTGELGEATVVYFPMAYAEKLAFIFESEEAEAKKAERMVSPIAAEVDCDVGLEATGKTIPYEWVVVAYREGEQMAVLKRLRASRGRPKNLQLGGPAETPVMIEGKSMPVIEHHEEKPSKKK